MLTCEAPETARRREPETAARLTTTGAPVALPCRAPAGATLGTQALVPLDVAPRVPAGRAIGLSKPAPLIETDLQPVSVIATPPIEQAPDEARERTPAGETTEPDVSTDGPALTEQRTPVGAIAVVSVSAPEFESERTPAGEITDPETSMPAPL